MRTPIVAFVGRSGSGKTTLIERLLPALAAHGVRTAVLKHSPVHTVRMDKSGTDTDRFWQSGARHVALAAQDRVIHMHRFESEPALQMALQGIHDVDLVLLEGYKRTDVPKVEVIRRAHDPDPIEGLASRIAVVTDVNELSLGCPKFGLDQVRELAEFLVQRLGTGGEGGTLDRG